MTVLTLLLLLVSCSLQATLTFPPEGNPTAQAAFRFSAPALDAWKSLRDLDPALPVHPFDPAVLQQSLGDQGRVTSEVGSTILSLPIPDLRKFLPTWKADGNVWEGTIDRAAVRRWAGLTAWAGSPAVDALLPAPGTVVSETEYRDLLVYLLGPGITETAARALIDASSVQLTVEVPRTLRSAPGASLVSGRTAVYRWPLVRVLTLETPIRIRLQF